jgi:hypothetical protein
VESKCTNTVLIISYDGYGTPHCTPWQEAKDFLWFNNTKCIKRVWQRYWRESGLDLPFKPSNYALYKLLFITSSFFLRGNYSLLQKNAVGVGTPA